MLTMLLGGLWHGANWTYVVWGGIHGSGLTAERLSGLEAREPKGLPVWLRRFATFAIVCFAWIFFRAQSFDQAFGMLRDLLHWSWVPELGAALFVVAVMALVCLLMDLRLERFQEEYMFQSSAPQRRLAFAVGLMAVLFLFSASDSNAFIYFQF